LPSLSKIPQDINKYAIKCARKICNEKIEFAKGIDFKLDKITNQTDFRMGAEKEIPKEVYNLELDPKDVFIHNHPPVPNSCRELSLQDVTLTVYRDIKKIFASTPEGYTSIDMTTVKKSLSKQEMLNWIFAQAEVLTIEKHIGENYILEHYKTIRAFAKFTGATFSEVKWNDYDKVRLKREP